jgi:hypothetical protein
MAVKRAKKNIADVVPDTSSCTDSANINQKEPHRLLKNGNYNRMKQ